MNDNLSAILVSETDIASEALSSTLQGIIQVGRETGKIIPCSNFEHLDRNSKILVFLLGLRAAVALGVTNKGDATVEEIAEIVGFDAKTVGEYASRLKRRFLARGGNGYTIPPEKIRIVCDQIRNTRQKEEDKT
jgi:hypothetical protein